jgi:Acyl-protein synthetase, LuxE
VKQPVKNMELEKRVFAASADNFNDLALELFNYQYQNNTIYRQYCDALKINAASVDSINKIPFLPISFFKTHTIKTTEFETNIIFESSGTTQSVSSKHYVKDIDLYRKSFNRCFEKFYGPPKNKCILGLLPAYLERKNSSLVLMTAELIKAGGNELSGFYLYDHEKLHRTLIHNELLKIPSILIGVTYALLDFAEQYPMQLRHTIVMETGGMKGRREEMTRQEVHTLLQNKLDISLVHSEYGMTELLSQAYSKGDGIFHCPGWMKILIRDEADPFHVMITPDINAKSLTGVINIIDLANIYSCSFIASDDIGRLHANGSFEVLGRMDNSDIRGCSLMAF